MSLWNPPPISVYSASEERRFGSTSAALHEWQRAKHGRTVSFLRIDLQRGADGIGSVTHGVNTKTAIIVNYR